MLPLNTSQVPRLFQEARALETAGRLEQARAQYEAVLQIDPRHAAARFQIGQIHYKLGRHEEACEALAQAAGLKPGERAIWGLWARALQKIDDPDRNAAFLKKAKAARIDRDYLTTLQNLLAPRRASSSVALGSAPPDRVRAAIRALQSGDAAGAARLAEDLRRAHPDVAVVANILANARAAQGQFDAAEESFRAAVSLDPNYAEAHCNFGRLLVERGRVDEGIRQLRRAVRLAPKMVPALYQLGIALGRQGQNYKEAADVLGRAVRFDPKDAAARLEYGRTLMIDTQHERAVAELRAALEHGADETDARLCLARSLGSLGRETEALEQIEAVLANTPDCGPAYASRASIRQTLGRFDEARADFREAIRLMPRTGANYRIFLLSEKLAADDPLIPEMQRLFEDPTLPDLDRRDIGFALAKAMEDTRQYDRVFTYLRPANDLVRKAQPYDIAHRRKLLDDVRSTFSGARLQAQEVAGAPDFAPIFVTGLPRSGTTLVEQIVASHSTVEGGGELGFARTEIRSRLHDSAGGLRNWQDLSDRELVEVGRGIEARYRARMTGAERITDKSVQSYTLIGAIRVVLPRARIVVVRRDPRDNLLSMYKNMFAEGRHLYSYSLRDLGEYYRIFEEILDFWREATPGWFHEIRYEDLLADPEGESRKLIAACDLEWEDRCLAFHENKRRVDTLSVHQVRQPLYRSSMKAWQRYADELGELFDALGGDYARSRAAE